MAACRLLPRYGEVKGCAGAVVVLRPEMSAMGFDNRSTDRKPYTEPISFARVKWLKNFVQIVAAQTSSAIRHSYLD